MLLQTPSSFSIVYTSQCCSQKSIGSPFDMGSQGGATTVQNKCSKASMHASGYASFLIDTSKSKLILTLMSLITASIG